MLESVQLALIVSIGPIVTAFVTAYIARSDARAADARHAAQLAATQKEMAAIHTAVNSTASAAVAEIKLLNEQLSAAGALAASKEASTVAAGVAADKLIAATKPAEGK